MTQRGGIADHLQCLRDQARLPDTSGAEHGEEVARALTHGAGVRISEEGELAIAAHHVRVEAPSMSECARHHLEQSVRQHPIALSLHDQRLERVGANRIARELERLFSDQDLPRRRRAFETLRHHDDVAADERVVGAARIAGDHLSAVDAKANLDVGAVRTLELDVQRLDRLSKIDGGAEGTKRVVLVQHGHPEDGHDGVADELLDPAAVPLESRTRLLVVRQHHAAETLGILAVAECRRARHVAEQHRDRLAHVEAEIRRRCQRVSARVAEPRVVRVGCSTPVAGGHGARYGTTTGETQHLAACAFSQSSRHSRA